MKLPPVIPEHHDPFGLARLRWSFRGLILVCGLIDCWNARFQNNPDGVSIMDIGDQYWIANWHAALNSYWSPLYGILTGLALRLTKPTIRWEYPEVHLINFLIFLATLVCFEFFWGELLVSRGAPPWEGASRQYAWMMGYLLFTCIYLGSRMLEYVNPDLLVSAFVLVIFGFVLRISENRASIVDAAWLGIAMGAGYLAKAAMFPFGLVVLATLVVAVWKRHRRMHMVGVALTSFLAISLPFIAALSWNNHRITAGDSGKLNIAWNVNGVNGSAYDYRLWQGDEGASSHRQHPARRILNWPEVYEFGTPIGGTYPVWEDPTYWWAGVDGNLHLIREGATFVHSLGKIGLYLIKDIGFLTAVSVMIFFLSDRVLDALKQMRRYWPVVIPAIAVFGMYAVVVWLVRYTTGVMLTLLAVPVVSLSINDPERRIKVLRASSIALGLAVIVMVMHSMFQNYHDRGLWAEDVALAEQLHSMGIERGDHIAIVGDGFDEEIWARLNGVEIVAEVPSALATGDSASAFWNSGPDVEKKVLDALRTTGAIAVVSHTPAGMLPPGWILAGNTGHAVFFFK